MKQLLLGLEIYREMEEKLNKCDSQKYSYYLENMKSIKCYPHVCLDRYCDNIECIKTRMNRIFDRKNKNHVLGLNKKINAELQYIKKKGRRKTANHMIITIKPCSKDVFQLVYNDFRKSLKLFFKACRKANATYRGYYVVEPKFKDNLYYIHAHCINFGIVEKDSILRERWAKIIGYDAVIKTLYKKSIGNLIRYMVFRSVTSGLMTEHNKNKEKGKKIYNGYGLNMKIIGKIPLDDYLTVIKKKRMINQYGTTPQGILVYIETLEKDFDTYMQNYERIFLGSIRLIGNVSVPPDKIVNFRCLKEEYDRIYNIYCDIFSEKKIYKMAFRNICEDLAEKRTILL